MTYDKAHLFGLLVGLGLLALLFQGVPIWFSTRAKHIGDKPYHWGTYIGVLTGLVGLTFFMTLFSAVDIYQKLTGAIIGICSVLASVGILQRRRFGALMFLVACLVVVVAAPIHEVISKPFSAQERVAWVIAVLPVLVIAIPTSLYFRKRWPLMR